MTGSGKSKSMHSDWDHLSYDQKKVMDAWERCLSGDESDQSSTFVRSIIHESWDRSVSKGINSEYEGSPEKLDREQLEYRKQQSNPLLAASKQTFANIGQRLNGTNAILLLTDNEGMVIDEIGDRSTLFAGKDINLTVGCNWNEDVIGTNGIGTTISTGKPVFVHGAEHFCKGIKSWSCSGAPIRDPRDGHVVGVIDLSGPVEIFQPYTSALIAEAAREIEKALAAINYEEQLKLLETFFAKLSPDSVKEDVIILDRFGRIAFCKKNNKSELSQNHSKTLQLGNQLVDLNLDEIRTSSEIYSALPKELKDCTVNVLKNKGIQGAMLVFNEKTNPVTGSYRDVPALGTSKTGGSPKIINPENQGPDIIGNYPPLVEAIETVRRLAMSPVQMTILIEGETGVGKELFAHLIHHTISQNRKTPFITINCGAFSKELIGGELFGHVPGSFTGALKEGKAGKFELANGGVLCLDEIGELPLEIQPFLLRVLEERVVYRISADKGIPIDVSLIAATNRVLKDEVARGNFRADLFYRISPATISIPPLRERGDDIMLLAEHFNRQMTEASGLEPLIFSSSVEETLLAYGWPGNVRQLKNMIEKLHILQKNRKIDLSDLPRDVFEDPVETRENSPEEAIIVKREEKQDPVANLNLENIEKETIIEALRKKNGNLSQVAKLLGISRPTLYRKMKLYQIRRHFFIN